MAEMRNVAKVEVLQQRLKAMQHEFEILTKKLKESDDRYTRMLNNLKEEFLFYRHDTEGKFWVLPLKNMLA